MIDRNGNQLLKGQLVLVPVNDWIPGTGIRWTLSVGTLIEFYEEDGGEHSDMAVVHTQWGNEHARCDRIISLREERESE